MRLAALSRRMRRIMYLICLRPPSNVETVICRLHEKLLREFGMSSAYALPVCIPLLFTESMPEQPQDTIRQQEKWETGAVALEKSAAYLEVRPSEPIVRLGRLFSTGSAIGPIPSYPGFYLGTLEPGVNAGRLAPASGLSTSYRFYTCTLSCMELRMEFVAADADPRKPWWSAVSTRECWRTKLRKAATHDRQ